MPPTEVFIPPSPFTQNNTPFPHNYTQNAHTHPFSEEDPFRKQDKDFGNLFLYFLRSFELCVYMEDGEFQGQTRSVLFYVEKANYLLTNNPECTHTFLVDLQHILMWKPPDDTVGAGKQLYHYICKYFLRISETLESRLQQFMEERMEGTLIEGQIRHFFLQFEENMETIYSIHDLKCDKLGELIAIRGQITRTSDVRPELRLGSFKCSECQNIFHNIPQQFRYTMPPKCLTKGCTNLYDWELIMESSTFGDWQKIRIQEASAETGSGSMPRSIDIILRDEIIDKAHPGDRVIVTGCLIVVPDLPALLKPGDVPYSVARNLTHKNEAASSAQGITGIKGVGVRDLGHKICFLAIKIEKVNATSKFSIDMTDDNEVLHSTEIFEDPSLEFNCSIARSPNTLRILADAIAPRVHGHLDIKTGVLLMLVGGLPKRTQNAKLRGDINMCIAGDPSTAKSQILKFVESFSPRAIFASGKGSTAAGLTAAVTKDPTQGDYVLEAGALMYADQGICCIDEFDKMDDKDRTSIHEAMEQQTISITKAGIQATLNARASVLAACNPKFGRYDVAKTFSQNVQIPAPLLSRFDLFYIMLDKANTKHDRLVSTHLLSMHLSEEDNESTNENENFKITVDDLRLHIELAKRLKPKITDEAKLKITNVYVTLRTSDSQPGARRSLRITARQLESLIRLSEATARLKFSDVVTTEHVDIATNVFKASLHRISNDREIIISDNFEDDENKPNILNSETHTQQSYTHTHTQNNTQKQNLEIRISEDEYQQIIALLTEKVREVESLGGLILSNHLIEWFIDKALKVEDLEEADKWTHTLQLILDRMILQENILLRDRTEDEGVWYLRLHPNLSEHQFANKTAHTSYGYATYERRDTHTQPTHTQPTHTQQKHTQQTHTQQLSLQNNNTHTNEFDIDLDLDEDSLFF